jgi:hypothetical protein
MRFLIGAAMRYPAGAMTNTTRFGFAFTGSQALATRRG